MRIAIVYDSIFGHTADLAWTMADVLSPGNEVATCSLAQAGTVRIDKFDLLMIGSPTRHFRPTAGIEEFVEGLDRRRTDGLAVAAFDTRLDPDDVQPSALRWVVGAGGYAADRIATQLNRKGFGPCPTAGFILGGGEGPLHKGEYERARLWARSLDRLPLAIPA